MCSVPDSTWSISLPKLWLILSLNLDTLLIMVGISLVANIASHNVLIPSVAATAALYVTNPDRRHPTSDTVNTRKNVPSTGKILNVQISYLVTSAVNGADSSSY